MGQSRKIIELVVCLLGAFATTQVLGSGAAQAADALVVRFGLFTETITLSQLQQIAQTGKFPSGYDIYTKGLSLEQRQQLVTALRTNIPISVVTMNNLLSTRIGSTILNDLSTVIRRRDDARFQAVRGALVLGATAPQGLSVLSFIANYPSKQLEIDLPQAFKVAGSFNTAFWQTQRFMAAIEPRLSSRKVQLKLPLDASKPGSATVQILKFDLDDKKRGRKIPVNLYWSKDVNSSKPVIIFSHGLGSVRTELKYLAEHLASYGYPVVVFEHPGSNEANVNSALAGKNRIMKPQEFLERPQDISFVLNQLDASNRNKSFPLAGKLATNSAIVVGYSFGGSTALAVGGAEYQLEFLKQRCKNNLAIVSLGEGMQCIAQELPQNNYSFRDTRIKRVIALNPTTSLLFGDTGLSKIQVPTLVLAASADKTTPALTEQIIGFDKLPNPKSLVGIVGAQAADVGNYVKTIVLASAAQLTPEAKKYEVFLTADYAQFASTTTFPIRLVTQIPSEAMAIARELVQK